MRNELSRTLWIILFLSPGFLGLGSTLQPPPFDPPCWSADLAAPVELPDGSVREGTRLRVCVVKEHTTEQAWHEVSIDGTPYGVYLGRTRVGQVTGYAAAYLAFESRGAALRLVGYARPSGHGLRAETVFGTNNRSVMSVDIGAVARAAHSQGAGTAFSLARLTPTCAVPS